MSYTFLLEQGEESSADCFQGIPPCALSKSIRSAEKSSFSASGTESSHLSQSGMTFAPSTGLHGGVPWILWLADSPAKTSRPLEVGREFRVRDPASGKKWLESSVRFDRATSL